ncbi:MAG: AMP-binding protein, partial [bacterium]|nr:AMP-binding protein [bacterium]
GQALFDHILVFENYPVSSALQESPPGLEITEAQPWEQTNYPLTVVVLPGSEIELGFLYDSRHFDRAAIVRMAGHFKSLLQTFVDDPRRLPAELAMLTPAERQQLVVEWNDTRSEFPRETTIPQLFERQAERMPDAVAVVFDAPAGYGLLGERLSYRELNRQANQLAHHLRSLGVGPDVLTGIYLERSARTVVGILGILKAGGAYLPVDLSYPMERLAFMLEDAGVPVLVTDAGLEATLPATLVERGVKVVCVDRDAPEIARRSDRNPESAAAVGAETLAYAIYTSGSTGRPKGVTVSHRAVVRLVFNTDYIDLGPGDRVAQASNTSFDAATFELWGALLHGGRLVGISKDEALEPPALAAAIEERAITALFLTTALFNQVAREAPAALGSVRHLLFG